MSPETPYVIGQRYHSTMEPELGIGSVAAVEHRQIVIEFPAAECQRRYASQSAPLKRVRFQPGDQVSDNQGRQHTVNSLDETDGMIIYLCSDGPLPETDLAAVQATESPLPRLMAGSHDGPHPFDLRHATLNRMHQLLQSPVRGFLGCRIALIPHQIDVAFETASRPQPRVLLADEVGLGKTIEAGMILHRQLTTGRMSRVLIIVPEALTVQWFIELYRRFHLSFTLVGDHPLKDADAADTEEMPFEDSLCLAGLEGLLSHPRWVQEAVEAQWDMVIIDEAHHLDEISGAYTLAQMLAARTPGLLLLTATPESIGLEAHFNRLRLLDPERYIHFDDYKKQQTGFKSIADLAARLLDHESISEPDLAQLESLNVDTGQEKTDIIADLVDRHGEGRAVFRNTRAHISGFPRREIHLAPLEGDSNAVTLANAEAMSDFSNAPFTPDYSANSIKAQWLVEWLKRHPRDKALLICRSAEKATALHQYLKREIQLTAALFIDEMSLMQRDRQAAWFADADGARLLIASEIGGEGRNFQFAHHLIFFDLPADPEKVEQRIGRLDRIGQRETVNIHLPYIKNSGEALVLSWLHEGLNAFEANVAGGHALYLRFKESLRELIATSDTPTAEKLLTETREESARMAELIHQGRDRLLELNAHRPERARELAGQMAASDNDASFRHWTQRLLNHFGVKSDPITPETWSLDFTLVNQPALPLPRLHEEGIVATFDRALAQEHEQWLFITPEHPLIDAAATLLLDSEFGNMSLARWHESPCPGFVMEMVFVLACVAPAHLYCERFLPPTPIHLALDLKGEAVSPLPDESWFKKLHAVRDDAVLESPELRQRLRELTETGEAAARQQSDTVLEQALAEMNSRMDREIGRLLALAKINPAIRRAEIEALITEKSGLHDAIGQASLRLDAIRLILPHSM